jgi:anti-anti-sigma factor
MESVEYELTTQGETAVVAPRDRLTDTDRAEFDTMLDQVLAARPTLIVFDCGNLSYMDSAGLALLLNLRERARVAGADVVLQRPRGAVRDMLTLARFDDLFQINETP